MPFEEIRSKRNATKEVSLSKVRGGGQKNRRFEVAINFTLTVIDLLGWPQDGQFEFLWGTGEDHGLLKIVRRSGGCTFDGTRREHYTTKRLNTSRVPSKMYPEILRVAEVEYEIEGASIIITLPKYFYEKQPEETL